jgi:hypothetical protein
MKKTVNSSWQFLKNVIMGYIKYPPIDEGLRERINAGLFKSGPNFGLKKYRSSKTSCKYFIYKKRGNKKNT